MDMQDKEFDQLFRSKLEDLEIEPSKAVWQGVDEGLGNNKRKGIIPFLSIAASIIVLIAAGVLFIPKKDTGVKIQPKNRVAANQLLKVNAPLVIQQQPITIITKPALVAINRSVKSTHTGKSSLPVIIGKPAPPVKNDPPIKPNEQQVLAIVSLSKNEVKQSTAIDSSKAMAAIKTPVQPVVTIAAVPDKQTIAAPAAQKIADAAPVKKHGIHGLGDVLNVVIAAVDKRKDKIIEFADSDGDGATVTAVNLGPIKVKKEN